MIIDIEKAFDFANQFFIIFVLKRYGFGEDFIKWVKTLLKNQEWSSYTAQKQLITLS